MAKNRGGWHSICGPPLKGVVLCLGHIYVSESQVLLTFETVFGDALASSSRFTICECPCCAAWNKILFKKPFYIVMAGKAA